MTKSLPLTHWNRVRGLSCAQYLCLPWWFNNWEVTEPHWRLAWHVLVWPMVSLLKTFLRWCSSTLDCIIQPKKKYNVAKLLNLSVPWFTHLGIIIVPPSGLVWKTNKLINMCAVLRTIDGREIPIGLYYWFVVVSMCNLKHWRGVVLIMPPAILMSYGREVLPLSHI